MRFPITRARMAKATLLFAIWTAYGLLSAWQSHYWYSFSMHAMSWADSLRFEVTYAWLWGACCPLILWLSNRYRFERNHRSRPLLVTIAVHVGTIGYFGGGGVRPGGGQGQGAPGQGGQGQGGQGGFGGGMGRGGNPPQQIKATDIKVGDAITASGEIDATAKSVGAVMIVQLDPERAKQMAEMQANFGKTWLQGKVTAIEDVKVTLTGTQDNAPHSFVADENTTFRKRRDPITLADIQVGDMVRADGAVKDGVFTATAVSVMGGGPGGPGGGPDGPGGGPAGGPPSGPPSGPPTAPPNGPQ